MPGISVYVKRSEDRQFLDWAVEKKGWANIYGVRTNGKSSLYAQHLSTLQARRIKAITVDVAAQVGYTPGTARDWVFALGEAISAELCIESRLLTGPLMGLHSHAPAGTALERLFVDGVLEHCKERIVLVLDEYDCIRQQPYCDDLLFAIRHIQALQARSKLLDRLSVCLVGLQPLARLGTPGAANTSPIAIPIEVLDFDKTPETVNSLMAGFEADQRPASSVLRRVLELSGGQPLITMELLRKARQSRCLRPADVDRVARDLVADSGLGRDLQLFVAIEQALVNEGGNAFAALSAYESLLQQRREAHSAPGADLLLTCGLVRRNGDRLEIKGELFARRFDNAWVQRMLSRTASGMEQHRGKVASDDLARGRTRSRSSRGGPKGKICVINTGGTLGMVERGDKVVPPRDADEFKGYFTSLASVAEEIEFINLFPPRDSINVFPDQWRTIARYIHNRRNEGFQGFVVAHGTDTMAYSASAVAFALGPQLRFPVVFTGAQTTPDVVFGDAHVNLYRACEVAKKPIPEVVISFGNFVYRAVRAQKRDDRRFDGFESPTYPPLAEITGEINVRQELLRPLPKKIVDIELRDEFEQSVLIVPQFPGLEPDFFEHLLQNGSSQQCIGVIVQTLGAGNVTSESPYSFIPFVARAYRQGIPVIVTSQYPPDPGTHTKYTPAQAPIKAGAIHAGNMTLAAAVVKFRWVLAQVRKREDWLNMGPARKKELVSRLMVGKSVVGEF
ncbi:MAG TPA: asparaginase domain-containing protein [Pyrinomonadaceae bacterium]